MRELKSDEASHRTTRKCTECPVRFKISGRKVACSPECALLRQARQLAALADRKTAKRVPLEPRPCSICQTPFKPKHKQHIYCSDPCAQRGLDMAVYRQKIRNAETKRDREQLLREQANDLRRVSPDDPEGTDDCHSS